MNYVYWDSIAFSFKTLDDLSSFVRHVERAPYLEATWIKNVQLEIWVQEGCNMDCNEALRIIITKLRHVKALSINFRSRTESEFRNRILETARAPLDTLSESASVSIVTFSKWMGLQALPLQIFTSMKYEGEQIWPRD